MNGVAAKEALLSDPCPMEIAKNLVADQRPSGPDGASNYDRLIFIGEVFDCDQIDLAADYDLSNIIKCRDIDMVEACRQLAVMQMQYFRELWEADLIDQDDLDVRLAFLTLNIQRMNWHLKHLGMDRKTPPFPNLH
jgi:hypothetical protein